MWMCMLWNMSVVCIVVVCVILSLSLSLCYCCVPVLQFSLFSVRLWVRSSTASFCHVLWRLLLGDRIICLPFANANIHIRCVVLPWLGEYVATNSDGCVCVCDHTISAWVALAFFVRVGKVTREQSKCRMTYVCTMVADPSNTELILYLLYQFKHKTFATSFLISLQRSFSLTLPTVSVASARSQCRTHQICLNESFS